MPIAFYPMLKRILRKHPLTWFYSFSLLIVILIIPLFLITGAGDAVDQAFQKTGAPFNTDLVTWVRLVIAFPPAFLGALLVFAGMSLATAALSYNVLPVDGFVWDLNLLSTSFLGSWLIAMFLDGGHCLRKMAGVALPCPG
jgi:hypothetical protein